MLDEHSNELCNSGMLQGGDGPPAHGWRSPRRFTLPCSTVASLTSQGAIASWNLNWY